MYDIGRLLKGQGTIQQKNLKIFGILLLILQTLLLIFYAVFIRMYPYTFLDALQQQRITFMQNTFVLVVLGVGFSMTFIKNHSISALAYTFLISAIGFQLYMLLTNFWYKVTFQAFTDDPIQKMVGLQTIDLNNAIFCIFAILVSFGSVIGRVGPKDLLIMAVIQIIFYTLNETLVKYKIWTYDNGGSATVHVFGAYFGLAVSWMLSKKVPSPQKPRSDRTEMIFSMLGTLILWIYWPSVYCYGANNYFEEQVISSNTIYAISGSCVSTFIVSSLFGNKIKMEDILNATLAGGVSIGAIANVTYLPPLCLAIGFVAGIVSSLCFRQLTPFLEKKIKLLDTCGTNNLHGIPGLLGGIFSGIIILFYENGYDPLYTDNYQKDVLFNLWDLPHAGSFTEQGLKQIFGTLCSLGIAIVSGIFCGFVMILFYDEEDGNFFRDDRYFQIQDYYSSYSKNEDSEKLLTKG